MESLADVIRNIPTNLVLVDEHWTESQLDVQFAQYVKDENLSEILLCGADTQVITTTRRRYWQYLNDPYREVYRKHKSAGFDGVPTYEPSEEQMENLAELAALLERQKKPPWLDLVEIHRELGEFDLAGRLCCYEALEYSVDSATYEGYRQWLLEQIERRVRAPLRYRW